MWISYQYHKPEISYFSFHSKSFTHFSLDSIHDYAYLFDILRQGEKTLWAISNEALYQPGVTSVKCDAACALACTNVRSQLRPSTRLRIVTASARVMVWFGWNVPSA